MTTARRVVVATGRGLWSFVVGDTPEFLVTVVIAVAFALVVRHVHALIDLGLPVIVVGSLAASVRRGRRRQGVRPRP